MLGKFQKQLQNELASIKDAGLFKNERIITNPQNKNFEIIIIPLFLAISFVAIFIKKVIK